jgi:hypothetical protein
MRNYENKSLNPIVDIAYFIITGLEVMKVYNPTIACS